MGAAFDQSGLCKYVYSRNFFNGIPPAAERAETGTGGVLRSKPERENSIRLRSSVRIRYDVRDACGMDRPVHCFHGKRHPKDMARRSTSFLRSWQLAHCPWHQGCGLCPKIDSGESLSSAHLKRKITENLTASVPPRFLNKHFG